MTARIRPRELAAISPLARRPRAPQPQARVDRAVHVVGAPARHDVVWLSEAARALQAAEAADVRAAPPPMAHPPGADAAPFPVA